MTTELPQQGCCWRLPNSALFRRPGRARPLTVPAPASGAGEVPTSRCEWNPRKRAWKPEVKAWRCLEDRICHRNRRGSSKLTKSRVGDGSPKFPPNSRAKLESKPRVLVDDQSTRGRPKRESKPNTSVETGSSRWSGIATLLPIVNVKTITEFRSSSQEKSYLIRKNEYTRRVFWIELVTTNKIFRKISWMVSSKPELNKEKLQKHFAYVEYSH